MTRAVLGPQLREESAFLDAVVGAVRCLDAIQEASLKPSTSGPAFRDETTELICDAVLGIASLRVTFVCLLADEPSTTAGAPSHEATLPPEWNREYLR